MPTGGTPGPRASRTRPRSGPPAPPRPPATSTTFRRCPRRAAHPGAGSPYDARSPRSTRHWPRSAPPRSACAGTAGRRPGEARRPRKADPPRGTHPPGRPPRTSPSQAPRTVRAPGGRTPPPAPRPPSAPGPARTGAPLPGTPSPRPDPAAADGPAPPRPRSVLDRQRGRENAAANPLGQPALHVRHALLAGPLRERGSVIGELGRMRRDLERSPDRPLRLIDPLSDVPRFQPLRAGPQMLDPRPLGQRICPASSLGDGEPSQIVGRPRGAPVKPGDETEEFRNLRERHHAVLPGGSSITGASPECGGGSEPCSRADTYAIWSAVLV